MPIVDVQTTVTPENDLVFVISVDIGDFNGNINAIDLRVTPDQEGFLNISESGIDINDAEFFEPGDNATFINPLLVLPETAGGFGFARVGGFFDDGEELVFATGPLGEQITINEPIFLSNVVLPRGNTASARIGFFDAGIELASIDFRLVPEPNTFVLMAM